MTAAGKAVAVANVAVIGVDLSIFFIDTPCVKYKKTENVAYLMAFLFPGIDGGQPQ